MTSHCPSCGDPIASTDHEHIIEYYISGDGIGTFGGEVLCRDCFCEVLEALTSAYGEAKEAGTAADKEWAVHDDLPFAGNDDFYPDQESTDPGGDET